MTGDPAAVDWLAGLPVFGSFADVADEIRYAPLPDGWSLAMSDVVASGQAIAAGRYKAVNMAAAAVITAVLNGSGLRDLPFVFGGDGAAIAVPPGAEGAARAALAAAATWIAEEMALTMRVAMVPVAAIRAAGRDMRVARMRASDDVAFALFAGGGSAWAEAEMKAGRFAVAPAAPGTRPDLAGLSCRWNPLAARRGNIVSLIVAPEPGADPASFRALVADLTAIAAETAGGGHPLPAEGPAPEVHFGGVAAEARAQAPPGRRLRARIAIAAQIVLTVILHRTGWRLAGFDARAYAREVTANSDFRKFDDGLKMTLDIGDTGLARIVARLDRARADGVARHGLHRQDAALITCIVPSVTQRDHIHFVDGAGGGYAEAARAMKAAADAA
ncbi:MAG: DUF3095 domain-containing protein [Paracoccaceae bacterium]|nr:MAG: DUF3095 domain-containing protein [Paracoccaceae bacterium]